MFYQLEIENFFSIREKQVIDLTVGKGVPEEPGRLVQIHTDSELRVPNIIAVYGPNASGKTNILRAISFIGFFILHSFQKPADQQLWYNKFQTAKSIGAEKTRLSVTFSWHEKMKQNSPTCPYTYTLELAPRTGKGKDRVSFESLFYKPNSAARPIRIFERDAKGKINISKKIIKSKKEIEFLESILRPDASVIPTLAQINNHFANQLMKAAQSILVNISDGTGSAPDDLMTQEFYANNPDQLEELNKHIRRIDLGIEEVKTIITSRGPLLEFVHMGLDRPREVDIPLGMSFESQGTRQFVRYFPYLHRALATGGIAVIDEFDSAIHSLILPEIARWFWDPEINHYNAQLWVACHSPSFLNHLIKEEILITEKSSDGVTKAYRLADMKGVRRDENFMQHYLAGLYGGVPNIG